MFIKKQYFTVLIIILSLIAINQVVIQYLLTLKASDGEIINISGRQRMYSQQVNLISYKAFSSKSTNLKNLKTAINNWKKAHKVLMDGSPELNISKTKDDIIYSNLENTLQIINTIDSLIPDNTIISAATLKEITKNVDLFLPQMENIVAQYKQKSDEKLHIITTLEIVLAIITLIVIFIEFQFIIKPSLNRIIKQNETLEKIAHHQSHTVRSPLSSILGLTDILKIDKTLTPEDTAECLDHLLKSTQKLDQIINENVIRSNKVFKTKI